MVCVQEKLVLAQAEISHDHERASITLSVRTCHVCVCVRCFGKLDLVG